VTTSFCTLLFGSSGVGMSHAFIRPGQALFKCAHNVLHCLNHPPSFTPDAPSFSWRSLRLDPLLLGLALVLFS